MKSPPSLSPVQTLEPLRISAQKVLSLEIWVNFPLRGKHLSFVCIETNICFRIFWCFVESSLVPQPAIIPSVASSSFLEAERQIGWTNVLKWMLPSSNSKSDTSASYSVVKWFQSSWMKTFLGDKKYLPGSKALLRLCAPKIARMSRAESLFSACFSRMQCAAEMSI